NRIGDPVLPKRMPVCRGVDGDYGLAQPHFGGGGQTDHAQIGAHLDDRVYVAPVTVELNELFTQHPGWDFGYGRPALALEINITHHFESAVAEIAGHLRVC